MYGSLPLNEPEVFFHEDTPPNPHSPYSASKAAQTFSSRRTATLAGSREYYLLPEQLRSFQFPEKLISLMVNNALQHKSLPVYGDGLSVRDWLYVEDHCKAINMIVSAGTIGEVHNAGGHNECSNISIVKKIIDECSKAVKNPEINERLITYVEDRKGHDRRYGIAPDKIKADLGWYPETAFEVGIVKTIRWYSDNPKWVEHAISRTNQHYSRAVYGDR